MNTTTKWTDIKAEFDEMRKELGYPDIYLVEETTYKDMTGGGRLGSDSYKLAEVMVMDKLTTILTVKYRDRPIKLAKRFIYQAIAEYLWPTIPYWKHRWYGLSLAAPSAPDGFPKGIKRPANALPRSKLVALTIAQVKRRFNSNGQKS